MCTKEEEDLMCSETKCGVTRSYLHKCCPARSCLFEDTCRSTAGTATHLRGRAAPAPSGEVSPLLADKLQE